MGECDECCDNCGCRWKDVWRLLLCLAVLIIVALIVVLIVAFAFVRQVVVTVDDASLSRLALVSTPATAFAYNLTLTLAVRNPNWAMSFKNTEPLEAAYSFDGRPFDRVRLAGEGDTHGAKKTVLYRVTSGSDDAFVALGSAGEAEFKKENATGVFEVEVVVSGEVKYTARLSKCKIEAKCPLKLQLALSGETVVFQQVKCKLAKTDKNC
ncbi:hypothetical protein QYE76_021382 [Lolium multiflorum]|uniref:Late embryogenesis abundant protein LEA-2 subgroup domain-containing protein n=1 Tax=Lolium multiflorum TaxID=4521 RepID=A0AAD8R7X0_LOLMU|nr:hypothetical protein QYE76_021382 [Lolium multiflorum]